MLSALLLLLVIVLLPVIVQMIAAMFSDDDEQPALKPMTPTDKFIALITFAFLFWRLFTYDY